MAKFYYNGVLLPEIPGDVLAEYPYYIIVLNGSTYILLMAQKRWFRASSDALQVKRCPNAQFDYNGTDWGTGSFYTSVGNWPQDWLIFASHDIPDGSETAIEIYMQAMTPVPEFPEEPSGSGDYYYGNDLLPEVPSVNGKPYYFIRRNTNYYKYEVMFASSQFYYNSSDSAMYTKDGTNCDRYELPMGADGAWTFVDSTNGFGIEAGRDCIFVNADAYNGASSSDVWMAAMTPVSDDSGYGNFYYGEDLLPKLPVLYGYQNVWIRKNNSTGYYDAVYADMSNPWYYDGIMTPVSTSRTVYWYRMPIAGDTKWSLNQTTTGAFGVDASKTVLWSRYDVPSGSIGAVEIYFAGSEPVPEFPEEPAKTHGYLVLSGSTLYTVTGGALEALQATTLTAQVFKDHGAESVPDGALLVGLADPEVLYWQDSEDGLPTLTATVTGTPYPQTVISNKIDLTHSTIGGIESAAATCTGDVVFAVSFDDKATWKAHNGSAWVTLSDATAGMSKAAFEAITMEQWGELYAGSSGFYVRFTLSDAAQSVEKITMDFAN